MDSEQVSTVTASCWYTRIDHPIVTITIRPTSESWCDAEADFTSCVTTTWTEWPTYTTVTDVGGATAPALVNSVQDDTQTHTAPSSQVSYITETIPGATQYGSVVVTTEITLEPLSSSMSSLSSSQLLALPTNSASISQASKSTPSYSRVVIPILIAVIILILSTILGIYLVRRLRRRKSLRTDAKSGELYLLR